MDINTLRNALMGLKGETPEAPEVQEAIEVPYDTEANQRAAIEQSNAAVENPNTQTKPERIEAVQKQVSLETPQGQLDQAREIASVPSNPSAETNIRNAVDKKDDKTPQQSAEMMKYKEIIDKMEALQNAPKKEASTDDTVMNWLTGIGQGAKVYADINNVRTPNVEYWGDKTAKKEASAKKEEIGGLKNLQEAYQKYMALQNKDAITPYQQKMLEEKALDRTAAQKREETKASSKAKEGKKKTKLEETREKNIGNRFDELQGQIPNRMANIAEAKALSKLIEDDQLDTGPGSKMAGEVGAFFDTEESTYKQRLDSLAEKAARSQLKANGEVRPTDADVEGMKKAMFNLGNTESANVKKLQDFIKQQEAGLNEYNQMKEVLESGQGLEDFVPKPTFKNEPESTGKYGDTVERNGKQYKWNPKAGKYQQLM
jgi:hypothetical protein